MWGIPENFAGMTNSMLHRSRAFVQLAGTPVTILTFEHRRDYDAVRKRLDDRGVMVDGMSVRNLWEDLQEFDDEQLGRARFASDVETVFEPLGDQGDHSNPLAHKLVDRKGHVLQVDHFRPDGSLLVSDRRIAPGREHRTVTLCDRSGQPLGTWRRIRRLYHLWLDTLPRDPIAWMIVDSKTSAPHLVDYHRDDVVTMHLLHASHLEPGTGRPMGELRQSRRYVLERLDQWDAAIILTKQQLAEIDALLGPAPNRYVIPHGRFVPKTPPKLKRSTHHGVMLTSLDRRKQIHHAIKAMKRVGRIGLRRVTLDVWGQGPDRDRLEKLIDKREAPVELRGYSEEAWKEFDKASFSLLTSNNEAFGLVLVESMGHGCIPISYDMPYGPSDIITHGVDGFLVPADDIKGLVETIQHVVSAKPRELAPIREAAYRRALEYNDESVTEAWGEVMEMVLAAKQKALASRQSA
jgi:poly(glycerol-phosphate) alpha-glucosyltransferase